MREDDCCCDTDEADAELNSVVEALFGRIRGVGVPGVEGVPKPRRLLLPGGRLGVRDVIILKEWFAVIIQCANSTR